MKIKTSQVEALKGILPGSQIISSPDLLQVYSTDASNVPGKPDLAVVAKSSDEVVRIMAWAQKEKIPVVPRGSGTGVTGGAVPSQGGIVLSLAGMHRILDINTSNMCVELEPGVITGDLKQAVEKEGLFYPPDPASLKACTIGGNIAENAGGPKAIKYGVTRDYCLGLEVVLSDGRILQTGARTLKSVVGYDLTRLFVGSEGTLGIITKIFLKLIHKPEALVTMRAFFPSIDRAVAGIMSIFQSGITPSTLELMDKSSIQCVCEGLDLDFPRKQKAMLLLEVDGDSAMVRHQTSRIKDLLRKGCGLEVDEALTEKDREELYRFRRAISPAIYRLGARKINEDICVPRDRLAACFKGLEEIAERYHLNMANFGHAGDGNIHVNILLGEGKREANMAQKAVREIFQMTIALGGSISGEHGIGLTKAPYIGMELDPESIRLMKGIKALFDPLGILNPGKIF